MTTIRLNEAAAFLLAHDDFLILTHRRPDGDTVGSAAALCRMLRDAGKTAWVYANPQFTPKFSPYLQGLLKSGRTGTETVVSVDIATAGLFPFGMEDAEVALAFDHHWSNEGFAARTCLDGDRAACGELIWALQPLLGVKPSREIAEAAYVAVSTDTGCFRFSNVTPNTLRVAAECLEHGAVFYPINRVMFEEKRWARLRLESYLVRTTEFYRSGLVAVSAIPERIMVEYGLTEDDVDDISAFGRNIEGVEIAVMLREVENGMGKISMRTSPRFSASDICSLLGGGGHAAAAGATVPGGIEATKAAVLAAIEKELNIEN